MKKKDKFFDVLKKLSLINIFTSLKRLLHFIIFCFEIFNINFFYILTQGFIVFNNMLELI